MERKVLGRGLAALIPKKPAAMLPREFTHLALDRIKPAKNQPRQEVSEKELIELTQSMMFIYFYLLKNLLILFQIPAFFSSISS